MIFVNLPVADLDAAKAFYEAIGFTNNPQFTDDTAACMVLSDVIHVMLLTHEKWRTFTPKAIPDARESAQVMLCISEDSRAGVDAITGKAIAAGGRETGEPDDYGFMYGRNFEDLDGHIWSPMWMDMAAATAAMQPETAAA
jgi:hypothetical protein